MHRSNCIILGSLGYFNIICDIYFFAIHNNKRLQSSNKNTCLIIKFVFKRFIAGLKAISEKFAMTNSNFLSEILITLHMHQGIFHVVTVNKCWTHHFSYVLIVSIRNWLYLFSNKDKLYSCSISIVQII
jgi:hypothetical protein